MASGGLFCARRSGVTARSKALIRKVFIVSVCWLSVSGVKFFCGEVGGVEEGEEDAAQGGLTTGGIVPLLEGGDASSGAVGAYGHRGYVSRKRDVSVG